MTTTPDDRQILRDWRDTHDNIRPARNGERCIRTVWLDGKPFQHGASASWLVNYRAWVPSLGVRPHCEACTVDVISKWASYERGEVPA
jgi:hypothetical protein